jgi:lipid A 3-O-deacylase
MEFDLIHKTGIALRSWKRVCRVAVPLSLFIHLALAGPVPLMADAQSEQVKHRGLISIQMDNDIFARTDRDYSNGLRLTWVSPDLAAKKADSRLPGWLYFLGKLSPFIRSGSQKRISIFFGQNIYTPADIKRSDLIEDDRPYAGLAYVGVGVHSRDIRAMDTVEFELGVVGPHSFAEQTQKFVHGVFNFTHPNGWDHQLHDELALEGLFEHKWKLLHSGARRGFGYDLFSHLGAGLGNVYIGSGAGVEVRCGINLPDDFGTFHFGTNDRSGAASASGKQEAPFSPQNRFGIHFLLGVTGEAVLRDIFLDGNTFGRSHSVDKKNFMADVVAGVTMTSGRFRISYKYVYSTKRFITQRRQQVYGQINLSFSY